MSSLTARKQTPPFALDPALGREWPMVRLLREGATWLQAGLSLRDPERSPELLALLERLYEAGRCDLALGRLLEGHADALQIVSRYGDPAQAEAARSAARRGALFGVWNAPLPGEPLRLEGGRLRGGKAFASGAGLLTHALVTLQAGERERVQLVLLDLGRQEPEIDRSWWRTLGMQRSESHVVRWRGARIEPEALVGKPGDYEREPWFSGGALRFVAVQVGGLAGLVELVRDHLVARDRAADAHQAARLGELFGLAEQAAALVRRCAERRDSEPDEAFLARVAVARTVVRDLCERALALAQQAVGVQGLFETHPISRRLADLMVYLRQPGPDAQRERAGRAVAERALTLAF